MVKNTFPAQLARKIFKAFDTAKLKYVLVGGAALAVHGLPRSTLDLDIYILTDKESVHKIFAIAKKLGLDSKEKDILHLADTPKLLTNQWICFSHKKRDILDVFLTEEKEFSRLYKNSLRKKDRALSIRTAALDDLKILKKASGRAIDLADLRLISEAQKISKR